MPIHHVRPRRAPLVRMAGRVLLAAVRLRLGDAPPNDSAVVEPTAKPRADKRFLHIKPSSLFFPSVSFFAFS